MVVIRSRSIDSRTVGSITLSISLRAKLDSTARFRTMFSRKRRFTPRSSTTSMCWGPIRFKRVCAGSHRWLKRLFDGLIRWRIQLMILSRESLHLWLSSSSCSLVVERTPISRSSRFSKDSWERSTDSELMTSLQFLKSSRLLITSDKLTWDVSTARNKLQTC